MKKKYLIILIIILFINNITGFIFAWLIDEEETGVGVDTGYFNIEYIMWFEKDGEDGFTSGDVNAFDYYVDTDLNGNKINLLQLSAGNIDADNHISKLRVQVSVETNSEFYLRVKFANEWFSKRYPIIDETNIKYTSLTQSEDMVMPYGIATSWYYDTSTNLVYYSRLVDENMMIDLINEESASSFTDKTTAVYDTKYYVYLDIQLEFVQANRMYKIWGIDEIPSGG